MLPRQGFSVLPATVLPPEGQRELNLGVEPILADISEELWNRADKPRRAPVGQITFDNIPPSFAKVIKDWKVDGAHLFRPARAAKRGFPCTHYWSYRPEAAHVLCRFEDMVEEQNRPADEENDVHRQTFTRAVGNCRLSARDDLTVITPPIFLTFNTTPVGPAKRRVKCSMVLQFTVMVVSAHRQSTLRAHPKYPKYDDSDSWPQVPWFDSPIDHYRRHLQLLVKSSALLDRTAMSVQTVLSWELRGPQKVTGWTANRRADLRAQRQQMWSEEAEQFVPATTKKRKETIASDNFAYRESRFREYERVLRHYQDHGTLGYNDSDAETEEGSGDDASPIRPLTTPASESLLTDQDLHWMRTGVWK